MPSISLKSLRLSLNESLTTSENTNCIRLLSIEADADNGSPIRGSLRIVNLDSFPRFAALSYVRGTYSTPPDTIICDDEPIELTSNCWSALWHLRKIRGSFDIWVDAVCIDRRHEAERLGQLEFMSSIFARADPAYLWLGPEANHSDRVMDYLNVAGFQDWSSSSSAFPVHIEHWAPGWHSMRTSSKSRKQHPQPINEPVMSVRHSVHQLPTMSDLTAFLKREWMDRIWTLQEAALAAQPVICCGTRLLPWQSLIRSTVYLEYIRQHRKFFLPDDVLAKWRGLIRLWLLLHHDVTSATSSRLAEEPTEWLSHEYFAPYIRCLTKIFRYHHLYVAVVFFLVLLLVGALLGASAYFYHTMVGKHNQLIILALFLVIWMALTFGGILLLGITNVFSSIFSGSFGSAKDLRRNPSIRDAIVNEVIRRNTLDPRDKYLGTYALFRRLGVDLKQPDRSMSQWDMYRELFFALMAWGVSLDLLVCAPGQGGINVPSWIPDFHRSSYEMQQAVPQFLLGQSYYFRATSPVPLEERPSLVQPINTAYGPGIVVAARRIGQIEWRCQSFGVSKVTTAQTLCDFLCKVLEVKAKAPSYMQQREVRSAKRPKDVFRYEFSRYGPGTGRSHRRGRSSMMKVQKHDMGHANNDLGRWTRPLWNASHFSPDEVCYQFSNEVRGLPPFLRSGTSPPFITWKAYPPDNRTNPAHHAVRTLFVTDQGLMGVGPQQGQVGDDIVLVRGVRLPLIMRPVGDCYRLMGSAEVEGIMTGQLWPNDNIDEMERITII